MKVLFRLASLVVGLLLFLCASAVRAQQLPKSPETTTLFDEYGRVGGCDHSGRLDNLAITLQNDPNLEGYLVYYGPESISKVTLDIIQDYLINGRGLGEERFKTIYAGPNSDPSEPRIQLWLAPSGASPPELARYESRLETFTGLFFERERWDGIYLGEGEGTGPPMPDVTLPSFVDMLNQRKDTVAYLVAFNGAEAAPGAWRRVAQLESEDLEGRGAAASRIKIIYGGTAKDTKVQFWILPEGDPAPVADAGAERLPEKTIQISSFGEYELADERGERWAFKVLLDGLRASEELRACIIVRLEREVEAEESEEVQDKTPLVTYGAPDDVITPDESPEPQPADFLKLVEKWKSELAEKHKIRPDRVVVLFAAPREGYTNTLETWIVPLSALLPDPYAELAEETADDAKPNEGGKENAEGKPEKNNPPG